MEDFLIFMRPFFLMAIVQILGIATLFLALRPWMEKREKYLADWRADLDRRKANLRELDKQDAREEIKNNRSRMKITIWQ